MARALILGIGGQDGAYLARLLVARGVEVSGTTRGGGVPPRLHELQSADAVTIASLDDDIDVAPVIAAAFPDHIYDLRGPAPWQAADVDAAAKRMRALLAAIDGSAVRLLVAGAGADLAFEGGFAESKDATAQMVAAARSAGTYAVTALLSEHESRLSGPSTAARLIRQAQAAARDPAATIELSHPERRHDWGWAPEYVDALWRMLEAATPADHRIATGTSMSEHEFARHACEWFGVDPELCGPAPASAPPPEAVPGPGGWRAFTYGRDLVRTLCEGAA